VARREREGFRRPKLRWLDGVDENSERICERNWRIKTRKRNKWNKP
jgi:hypothetical protein